MSLGKSEGATDEAAKEGRVEGTATLLVKVPVKDEQAAWVLLS